MKSFATITGNSLGQARHVRQDGRDWLVVPMTSIVPGVLPGSKGPLLYPQEECVKNLGGWDGQMLTKDHPYDPMTGEHVSSLERGVWERQGLGWVRNTGWRGKLRHEGWIDVAKANQVDKRIVAHLLSGKPMELSTGLYTDNEERPGACPKTGRPYTAIARNYQPDHIALLPDQVGACSIRDGCGVLVNEKDKLGCPT